MDVAFRRAVNDARRQGGLPFACLLTEDRIEQAFGSARWFWQGWIYSPAVTLWVFLSQCLSADHSCREAVARLIAWRLSRGEKPCSADTGGYCTARDKLPEEACRTLVRDTGRCVEDEAADDWFWLGRRVRCVDGTTITMPDTPDNQAEYPQLASQRPGCGFPILRDRQGPQAVSARRRRAQPGPPHARPFRRRHPAGSAAGCRGLIGRWPRYATCPDCVRARVDVREICYAS